MPEPIYFVHVPKTGGTSVRHVLREWYGDDFLMDEDVRPSRLQDGQVGAACYMPGRDVRFDGPLEQAVLWVRDPFDWICSVYFYWKQYPEVVYSPNCPSREAYGETLMEFARNFPYRQMHWWPKQLTQPDDFEKLRFVGLTSRMQHCLQALGHNLGRQYTQLAPHCNESRRDELAECFRQAYKRLDPWGYDCYMVAWEVARGHCLKMDWKSPCTN